MLETWLGAEPGVMVIPDAENDAVRRQPFVTGDFGLRFYAGVAVHGPNGKPVGALGLVDTKPREFSAQDVGRLKKFGSLVEAELLRGPRPPRASGRG